MLTPQPGTLEWVEWQAAMWAEYVALWGGMRADFYLVLGQLNKEMGASAFQSAAQTVLDAAIGFSRHLY